MSAKLDVLSRNDSTGWGTVGWFREWTTFKGPLMPLEHEYEEVCKRCSAALAKPELQASGSDTGPSTDID